MHVDLPMWAVWLLAVFCLYLLIWFFGMGK